ncbi:MAG: hypothetical protein AB1664_07650 [Thermodesulfobacteriota bacterium]
MKSGRIPLVSIWMIALAAVTALIPWQAVHSENEESIKVSKAAIVFDKENAKRGEVVNIDNRSGSDLTLGLELPDKGLSYSGVIRKPEQRKVPREDWARFTLSAGSGVLIVIIPGLQPAELQALDGTEIRVRIHEGNELREVRRIPIKVHADLLRGTKE